MTGIPLRHDALDAMVEKFNLVEEPVDMWLRQLSSGLDYGRLIFGQRYLALQSFAANRHGEVTKGEKLHFLGYFFFPFHDGLRLFFERRDGGKLFLEFEEGASNDEGEVDMIDNRNVDQFFAPVRFDLSKRTKRLTAARAIIEFHKKRVRP